jgi:hypothetical protein
MADVVTAGSGAVVLGGIATERGGTVVMWAVGIERVELRGATAELQYSRRYSTRGYCSHKRGRGAAARAGEGRWERRPWGFAHGWQERRFLLLISCLIRLIHLLSLYKEDVLLDS